MDLSLEEAYKLGCDLAIKEAFQLVPKAQAAPYMTHGQPVKPVASVKKKPLTSMAFKKKLPTS
jgi:hypothetical protein